MPSRNTESRPKLRFVREDPVLANILKNRRPNIGQNAYDWAVEWVEDIGYIIRSRDFMASSIASQISSMALDIILSRLI